MRRLLPYAIIGYVLWCWTACGNPALGWQAQHKCHDWPWEHSLYQWGQIEGVKQAQSHPVYTYGPANFHSDGPPYHYWEDFCWVTIQVPGPAKACNG